MSQPERINLVDAVGSPFCISSDDGEKIYEIVASRLLADAPVILSFEGVEDLSTAFLNSAVGQLYGEMDELIIRRNLLITDANIDQMYLLGRVANRARAYFAEPARFRAATADAFDDR